MTDSKQAELFINAQMQEPIEFQKDWGEVCVFSRPCPGEKVNGDSVGFVSLPGSSKRGCLLLADGAGGTPGGNFASGVALNVIADTLISKAKSDEEGASAVRSAVLDAIELAKDEINNKHPAAGSTLNVFTIEENQGRAYIIGDSSILISGSKGKRKFQSVAHSPTGLAVEAGFLDEEEALNHPERNLVLNLLGLDDYSIGLSNRFAIEARDTVLLCSDGLTDNLTITEIIETIRKGPLREAALKLIEIADKRMSSEGKTRFHNPDDLSFLLFRQ